MKHANRSTALLKNPLAIALATLCASTVPTVANAQPGMTIEEVTVTARRRSENLQNVPVSVSAFNDAALEAQGIADITELQQRLPNTTLQVSRATNTTLTAYIRGIGQQDPLWGFEPGVGIYIDDVYIARPQGAVLDVLDVESIEVLRGPQGTLYGKNTIGGALKYQTRRLGNEPTLDLSATYGSYDRMELKAAGSVPIVEDKLFIGGGVAIMERDGFGEFINTGEDNYNKDVTTGHIKVEWRPQDNLEIVLAADRTEDDSNARGGYRLTPSLTTGQQPYSDVFDSDSSLPTENKVETEGYSATITWDASDNITLKSITAAREGDTYTNIDFDATAVNSFDVPAVYDDEQFTQELQIAYSGDRLNGVAGLYYYDGEACGVFDVILGLAGSTIENGGCVDTESYSIYAQFSYDVNEQLSINVGGRYTEDEKEADVFRFVYLGPKFPNEVMTPFSVQSDFSNDESWNEFTPHVGVQYQINDDVMAYASYTTGFKSGGFDMRANASVNPRANEPFDPETVESYELGIKSTLMDERLRLNAAIFYNDYTDMQVTVQRAIGSTDFATQVVNAGESEMSGAEIEAVAVLADNLTLTAVVGYIDAKFTQVDFFNPETQRIEDVSDIWVISNTPEWSSNLSLNYVMDIAGWSTSITGSVAYRDDTSIFELPSVLDEESYALYNASIVATSPNENWWVALHGKNLGDKEYRVAGYNFPATFDGAGNLLAPGLGGEDTVTGFYGDPRTVAVSVGYRF